MNDWRQQPEVRLLALALPLEAFWEIAQLPLYTLWYRNSWDYILYSLAHCTVGDLLILLIVYESIAVMVRDRRWFAGRIYWTGTLFTLVGAAYTVYSETTNTVPGGAWEYTARMPIVPVLGIGAAPMLQWLLIPPLLLWLMRRSALRQ
ncbi:MAG: hypothetical protein HY941_09255 [Gammaproteobacteria bacterium]|nr:hypothetical protein [Gammaproteobacteria bacterium]